MSSASPQDRLLRSTVEKRVVEHFQTGSYDSAASLLEAYLREHANDATMHYNLACAYARLGREDDAATALLEAVRTGFVGFDHMQQDPDLRSLHSHPTYTAIVEAARRASQNASSNRARAMSAVERWRLAYGEGEYRYDKDEKHGLAYATALDEHSHREMRAMLEAQADHLAATFFDALAAYDVLVAIPTPAHAKQLLEADNVGGVYYHNTRQLISRNIGSSLRHEFFHLMHYRHMEKIGQQHPLWMQEGLASLYEDYSLDEHGRITYLPNDRHNIVKRRQAAGRLTKWSVLFATTAEQFMDRAGSMYPEARSIFEFIASTGKLPEWYKTYVQTFHEDPSSVLAFEQVFGQPIQAIERDWHRWIRASPMVDSVVDFGDASLGIRTNENGVSDGVLVTDLVPGYGAARAGVRRGDVIVAIGDGTVRSLQDLITQLGRFSPGDVIPLRLRRQGEYIVLDVRLRAKGQP